MNSKKVLIRQSQVLINTINFKYSYSLSYIIRGESDS